jgi:hypothetical protein
MPAQLRLGLSSPLASRARIIAVLFGFFTLTQSGDRPEL